MIDDTQIWKNAVQIAEQSNCKKRHVGCIIVDKNGTMIATGYNKHENGVCDCATTKTAIHAEQMAISMMPEYLLGKPGFEAYVTHPPCDKCETDLSVIVDEVWVQELSPRLLTLSLGEEVTFSDDVLLTRGGTHGVFSESAEFVQQVKDTMRQTQNWPELSEDKREALDMIQHKIGRILHGDANFQDHWTDISGYARLVEKEL